MVIVPAGAYTPFYQPKDKKTVIPVSSFYMDPYAVTNEEYLRFVMANPSWRRSKAPRLFADTNYLAHWKGDTVLGQEQIKNSPVTNISWFAAKAYAQWQKKRLPTMAEWEYAANANLQGVMDENDRAALTRIILQWYEKPNPPVLPSVGTTFKNNFGVYDMHGLVWEWVYDFNNRAVSNDSRTGNNSNTDFFCSDGSLQTLSKEDYASYMRYSFRYSLKGNYCVKNLGFRCVKNLTETKK